MKIETKIEYWKNKLLDLGKRNKMINCPMPKPGKRISRTTLVIEIPAIDELWNKLSTSETGIEFPVELDAYAEDDSEDRDKLAKHTIFANGYKTNQSVSDTCKTLISLKNKAREFMENKGMNALYLAFGFLNWKDNGTTGQSMRSPLILVPVSITQQSIADPIFLAKTDEDPMGNNSLQQKLFSDFNISIPEYEENEDLFSYFTKVENECKSLGWTVDCDSVQLLMLSYLKMAMFHDIETHEEAIKSNPIIRTLNGETDQIDYDSIPKVGTIDHDAEEPRTVFSVVDADSSQQDAITLAKSGASFVLQGPPGTGKSQTITNIIAELLGQGKKVLFVSEKMAALEVVYRRLVSSGLADFCLTLHNPDAKRKEIMEQLAVSVKLSESKVKFKQEAFQKLETLKLTRETLNEYVSELHTEVEPLGETIYRVNGYIAKLEKYPDIDFIQDNAGSISSSDFAINKSALSEFTRIVSKSGYQSDNPWLGCTVKEVNHLFRQKFLADSENLLSFLGQGSEMLSGIGALINNGESQLNYQTSIDFEDILRLAVQSPTVPYSWFSVNIDEVKYKLSAAEIEVSNKNNEEELLDNIKKHVNGLTFSGSKMFEYIMADNDTELNVILEQFHSQYQDLAALLTQEDESVVSYSKSEVVYSLQQYSDFLEKLRNTEQEKTETEAEISRLTDEQTHHKEILDNCEKNSDAANKLVTASYRDEILELDISILRARFNDDYRSFFRFLNSQYRKDCKMLRSYSRTNERTKYKNALELLELIDDAQQKKGVLDEQLVTVQKLTEKIDDHQNTLKTINDNIVSLSDDLSKSRTQYKSSYDRFVENTKLLISKHNDELNRITNTLTTLFSELSDTLNITLHEGSDIKELIHKFGWISNFYNAAKTQNASEDFLKMTAEADQEYLNSIESWFTNISVWNAEFQDKTSYFLSLFDEGHQNLFLELTIVNLLNVISDCHDNFHQLETLIDYRNAVFVIEKQGLSKFLDIITTMKLDSSQIVPCYEKCFYRSWLDYVIPNFEGINLFRHDRQEERIKEFRDLDKTHMRISQTILKGLLIDQLPNLNFSGNGDEAAILKRELNKKSRLMPIRKLIACIPSLLPSLKPCMMMSPLSVSTYFSNADFSFDTVIFDEASQVRTEEAICSILRAKQVIIAGDSKQLPPTNFFSTSVSDSDEFYEDEEGINDAGAYESLLDEAAVLPTQTLLWHYRSKHEHLIAFSNYKIYQKSLITFPSAVNKSPDLGVEYVYIEDGIYERGGKGGNIKEAERIARILIEHFTKHPDRSIGIIAFGEKQQNVIENEVLKLRQAHPEFEQYFRDNCEEPLFIRNLESVQGDERDTIIFSIGYGYDASGKFLMNFGPLSRDGGERRLNVAVTRARYNLKLVGSILPTDIKTDRISALGPKLLREYIDFAINGENVLKSELSVNDEVWFDSPFEESVYDFLTSQGYKVATQVGCSGYRIDMAISHPDYDGRFAIGIECDGAAYHSARTARERDRLRQTILENMGWKIYRIWSTDWIKDAVSEKKRLLEAVESAIANYNEPKPINIPQESSDINYVKIIEKTEEEIQAEQKKKYRSSYSGLKPQDIPIHDFEETVLKILSDGYGRRQADNLIKDAANYGYDWKRVGKNIKEKFYNALHQLEKAQKIEMSGDEVRLL